ncbi:MAG: hypothetical protein OSB70_04995 [Myxococcota bacterium]|nr:hypothetical protein [Myxococcota bacterium]
MLSPLQLGFDFVDGQFQPPREFGVYWELNTFETHDIEPTVKERGVERILLLGDSFVQGLSVPVEETVTRRLAHHLSEKRPGSFDTVALAGSGASPEDELRELKESGEALEPDWVISVIYLGNDVMQSMLGPARYALVSSGDVLPVFHGSAAVFSAADARHFFFEDSRLNQLISQRLTLAARKRQTQGIPLAFLVYSTNPSAPWRRATDRAWAELERLLRETRAEAESLGARYAVVSIASPYTLGGADALALMMESYPDMRRTDWNLEYPEARLADLCRENGFSCRSLLPGFRAAAARGGAPLHWKFDRHWSPAGHDRAAQEMAALVVESGSKGKEGSPALGVEFR